MPKTLTGGIWSLSKLSSCSAEPRGGRHEAQSAGERTTLTLIAQSAVGRPADDEADVRSHETAEVELGLEHDGAGTPTASEVL
jgi:hypothetical protein